MAKQLPRTNRRRTRTVLMALAALFGAVILLLALGAPAPVANGNARSTGEEARAFTRASSPAASRATSRTPRQRPAPRRPAGRTAGAQSIFRVSWGAGPGQLGRDVPDEGSPEGPASFAVGRDGRVYVLDQVNSRIQVFAGNRVVQTIPLRGDTYEDIALLESGTIAVLDRLVARTVTLLDARGQLVADVGVLGRGVPEGGAVTGLFAQKDGLWLEVGHRRLVRIADAQGRPDASRPSVPGRFSADGSQLLQAALDGRFAAQIRTRPVSAPSGPGHALARIDFPMRVANLTALESDTQGNVYLGARMMRHRQAPPYDLLDEASVLVVISPTGRELRRVSLTTPGTALGFLRNLHVDASGAAWHLAFDRLGATLTRYR